MKIRPDVMGPNCFQRLSADNTSRQSYYFLLQTGPQENLKHLKLEIDSRSDSTVLTTNMFFSVIIRHCQEPSDIIIHVSNKFTKILHLTIPTKQQNNLIEKNTLFFVNIYYMF